MELGKFSPMVGDFFPSTPQKVLSCCLTELGLWGDKVEEGCYGYKISFNLYTCLSLAKNKANKSFLPLSFIHVSTMRFEEEVEWQGRPAFQDHFYWWQQTFIGTAPRTRPQQWYRKGHWEVISARGRLDDIQYQRIPGEYVVIKTTRGLWLHLRAEMRMHSKRCSDPNLTRVQQRGKPSWLS